MALTTRREDEVLRKLDETHARLERLEGQLAPLLELKDDLQPIINEAFRTLILELDELDGHFRGEDALFLLKRLLRNTRNLTGMLERLEQLDDFVTDVSPIVSEATRAAITELDKLERQGIFRNLAALRAVAERFCQRYRPDRVVDLGDQLIELIGLVDRIAQPRTLHLVRAAADAASGDGEGREKISLFGLLRRVRDPDTLRGLALMLDLAKALGRADDTENRPMLEGATAREE